MVADGALGDGKWTMAAIIFGWDRSVAKGKRCSELCLNASLCHSSLLVIGSPFAAITKSSGVEMQPLPGSCSNEISARPWERRRGRESSPGIGTCCSQGPAGLCPHCLPTSHRNPTGSMGVGRVHRPEAMGSMRSEGNAAEDARFYSFLPKNGRALWTAGNCQLIALQPRAGKQPASSIRGGQDIRVRRCYHSST
ncbi:uncharacterized protein LOC101749127 isoform X2 [Gallus gallus]|uniref:uncharacterized protein LOC101749127 isoform X2 n=1 Tax=Gallus gallus TaxID=9031 RepID=UPI001F0199EF|nr:uncharacterized protein LOC101749127 isoform X2 [Gallus gallus]